MFRYFRKRVTLTNYNDFFFYHLDDLFRKPDIEKSFNALMEIYYPTIIRLSIMFVRLSSLCLQQRPVQLLWESNSTIPECRRRTRTPTMRLYRRSFRPLQARPSNPVKKASPSHPRRTRWSSNTDDRGPTRTCTSSPAIAEKSAAPMSSDRIWRIWFSSMIPRITGSSR